MRTIGPKHLDSYLSDTLLKRLGRYMDQSVRLRAVWSRSVGEPLSSHTQPVRFSHGCLHVRADSSAWASRLRQRQQETATLLRQHPEFKNLEKIQIRVQPIASESPTIDTSKTGRRSRLNPQAARLVRATADNVSDPKLQGALRRLGAGATSGNERGN